MAFPWMEIYPISNACVPSLPERALQLSTFSLPLWSSLVEAFAISFILPKHRKGLRASFNRWVRWVAFGWDIPKLISDIPVHPSTKLAFNELDWKVLAPVLFRCRPAILQAHNEWGAHQQQC